MDTLLLDTVAWDLTLDSQGNMAVASNPYSLSQDAASAVRLFAGEQYYNTTQGTPYFGATLGQLPPLSLIKAAQSSAALTVPEVATANAFVSNVDFTTRTLTGQVQVTPTPAAQAAIAQPKVATGPFLLPGGIAPPASIQPAVTTPPTGTTSGTVLPPPTTTPPAPTPTPVIAPYTVPTVTATNFSTDFGSDFS